MLIWSWTLTSSITLFLGWHQSHSLSDPVVTINLKTEDNFRGDLERPQESWPNFFTLSLYREIFIRQTKTKDVIELISPRRQSRQDRRFRVQRTFSLPYYIVPTVILHLICVASIALWEAFVVNQYIVIVCFFYKEKEKRERQRKYWNETSYSFSRKAGGKSIS